MTKILRKLDPEGFYDKTLLTYSFLSLVGTLFSVVYGSFFKTGDFFNFLATMFGVSLGVSLYNLFLVCSFYKKRQY